MILKKNKGAKMKKNYYNIKYEDIYNTPNCDIFGYLMASAGVTKKTPLIKVVEMLYLLKRRSNTFKTNINTILTDIIVYGDIDGYMECLTNKPNEFITAQGEIVEVADQSIILGV